MREDYFQITRERLFPVREETLSPVQFMIKGSSIFVERFPVHKERFSTTIKTGLFPFLLRNNP